MDLSIAEQMARDVFTIVGAVVVVVGAWYVFVIKGWPSFGGKAHSGMNRPRAKRMR